MKINLKKIFGLVLFIFSLHLFYSYVGVYRHLSKRPCSVHSWAQTERASIALNYYQFDMNLFKPRIHKALDGEGITGLEFPLVNYSAAVLYKIFGFKELYYKLFVLFTLIFGLILFYYLSYSFTKSYILSLLGVGSAYFSPALIYYSANFIPDTTSLGFVLASWYFFFQYLKFKEKKFIIVFFVLATLAALVKISSLIVFGVFVGIIILDQLRFFHKTNNNLELIQHKKTLFLTSILCVLTVVAWYKYANWLSAFYHSDAFLLSSKFVTSKKQAIEVWSVIKKQWLPDYYKFETYNLLIVGVACLILFYKYVNRVLFTVTFLTILGSAAFVFLLFYQFRNHDYYIITILPCVFLLLITFLDALVMFSNNYFPPLKFIAAIIIFFNAKECVKYCKGRYLQRHDNSYLVNTGDFRMYEDLEPKLRKLGIKNTDITLTGFDGTYCNSLYLMNQRGWNIEPNASKEYVDWIIKSKNIKYLILNDSSYFNKLYPNNFNNYVIGHHRNLIIYKLK